MDVRQVRLKIETQCDALLLCQGAIGSVHLFQQLGRRHRLAIQAELPGFRLRERTQIIDEALEVFDLGLNRIQTIGSGIQHTIPHGFHVATDDGERIAQIMSDIGGHAPARGDQAFQVGAHLVECGCQFAELILRSYGDALAQITGGQRTDGDSEIPDGMGEGARQNDAEDKCQGQTAEGGVEQCNVGAREVAKFQAAEGWRIADDEGGADADLVDGDGRATGESGLGD